MVNAKYFIVNVLCISSLLIGADLKLNVRKIEPPNWWTGMNLNKIQLMIYGDNLDSVEASFDETYLKVIEIHDVKNPGYTFIDIEIGETIEAGEYTLNLKKGDDEISVDYPIFEREIPAEEHVGFSDEDAIYLIFPDRFANGDTTNDKIFNDEERYEFGSLNGRHGGDIKGMTDKLNYIKDLGCTAIWSTPLLENNMAMSYHGYAATNLYKIDPRFGNNELYKSFVAEAHKRGLKIILDHVANHIGIGHEWIRNLPTPDWLNGTIENHQSTMHNKMAMFDVHSDSIIISNSQDGWFTDYMPDLNQRNEYVRNYIIQNTIWWIEYAGIDAIREDTYPYNNQAFMAKWAEAIMNEYPNFNIFGEVWKGEPVFLSAYQGGSLLPGVRETNLPSITDFALRDAIIGYLNGSTGLNRVYEIFAEDFIYPDYNNLVVFLDNHDIDRAMYIANGRIDKIKAAFTLLFTTRGVPQILYGTEIGLAGGGHHGRIRQEFPGGFPGNENNAFTEKGRSEEQNDIFDFFKYMLHLRQKYKTLSNGNFLHYPSYNNLYVYFKEDDEAQFLITINGSENKQDIKINMIRYKFKGKTLLRDLFSGDIIKIEDGLTIPIEANTAIIYKVE